jgi:hypothetical protein
MNPLKLTQPVQAWYREPWPWLLMSGPAAVIVAGVITTTMAFTSADGLVASDYYKQGLMINMTLARDQAATQRHLSARGELAGGRMRLTLSGDTAPRTLSLRLVHPTRAGLDHSVVLTQVQPGIYEGPLDLSRDAAQPAQGWLATLEQGDWRLTGNWLPPAPLQLRGAKS